MDGAHITIITFSSSTTGPLRRMSSSPPNYKGKSMSDEYDINNAFPKKYGAAFDLGGSEITVTIIAIRFEDVGQAKERKPILYNDRLKPIVLNRTNSRAIAKGYSGVPGYGDDMRQWIGKQVTLFEAMVSNPSGEMVPAIRMRIPRQAPSTGGQPTARPAPAPRPSVPPARDEPPPYDDYPAEDYDSNAA